MTPEETRRAQVLREVPLLRGFLATLLQDLQYREADEACTEGREERDAGTIYDCPLATFEAAADICSRFYSMRNVAAMLADEQAGIETTAADLYLTAAGHGAGFWDGGYPEHGDALTAAVKEACPYLETYIGDDGGAYIYGKELTA